LDGSGLARQYRPGLDGYQLSLGGARQPGSGGPVRAAAGAEDEDRRAAEAHRHAARTHFQRGSRHPAGDACGECEGLRGDGARVQAVIPWRSPRRAASTLLWTHAAKLAYFFLSSSISFRRRANSSARIIAFSALTFGLPISSSPSPS